MLSPHRESVLLATVLFLYTVLVALPFYLAGQGTGSALHIGSVRMQLASASILFLALLSFLIIWHRSRQRHLSQLSDQLDRLREEVRETKENHQDIIEKRTFELEVVNASLNREIAEKIQAETESKALQKRLELILNSAGEGIFGLDTGGKVTFVNTAAALMVGWEKDELIGTSHHDLVHHTNPDGTLHDPDDCLIRLAYQDGIVHASSDDVFWTREGTSFPVEYVSTPIFDNNRLLGAVVVFRDLSTYA